MNVMNSFCQTVYLKALIYACCTSNCSCLQNRGSSGAIKNERHRATLSPGSFLSSCTHNCSAHLSERRFNDLVDCICLVQLTTDQVMPQINQESIVRAYFTEMGRFRMKFYLSFSFLSLNSDSSSIYCTIPFFLSLWLTLSLSLFQTLLCTSYSISSVSPAAHLSTINYLTLLTYCLSLMCV